MFSNFFTQFHIPLHCILYDFKNLLPTKLCSASRHWCILLMRQSRVCTVISSFHIPFYSSTPCSALLMPSWHLKTAPAECPIFVSGANVQYSFHSIRPLFCSVLLMPSRHLKTAPAECPIFASGANVKYFRLLRRVPRGPKSGGPL